MPEDPSPSGDPLDSATGPPGIARRPLTPDTFAAFYQASYGRLCGQLYAYLGDPAEAEDIAQEALLRTWQRWRRVSAYDDPLSWVRRVAVNLANSRWRRIQAGARALHRHGPRAAPVLLGPDHVALVDALRTLPERQRLVLVLHYLADQPVAAIAAELRVPKNTVLSWLSRGRATLADRLRDDEPEHARTGPTEE
ncbi:SigE family RNA polymerase sigma factor [Micromonospora zhanjiangensis]